MAISVDGKWVDRLRKELGVHSRYDIARDEYEIQYPSGLREKIDAARLQDIRNAEFETLKRQMYDSMKMQHAAAQMPSPLPTRRITADVVKTNSMYQVSIEELKVLWQLKFPDWKLKIGAIIVPGDEVNDDWYYAQERLMIAGALETVNTAEGFVLIRLK